VDPAEEQRDFGLFPRFISRAYWVFNVSQVDNFTLPEAPERTPVEVHDDVEAFVRATDASIHRDPNRAYYNLEADIIHMVDPAMFRGSSTRNATEAYYAVLLHELTHWTGAKHRLDREFGLRFGDKAYAFEELVAELGAAFMCSAFGITNEPRPDHAIYVASWLEVLNNDARAIFTAANRAQEGIQFLGELAAARLDPEPAGQVMACGDGESGQHISQSS
jgi:antirestriction protein ArdC